MPRGHRRRDLGCRAALTIFLVSLAGLLLEVGYTRIVSYKLWYYYTYLVIGLALLGIGSGSVFVAVFTPVRRWTTDRIIAVASIWGAVSIALGYLVVAVLHVDTIAIWDYGTRAVVHEPAPARRHLLRDLRHVHRVRRHRLGPARAGRRRRRPHLLLRPRRRRSRLPARDPAHHAARPAPRRSCSRRSCSRSSGWLSCPPKSVLFGFAAVTSVVLVVTVVGAGVLPDIRTEDEQAAHAAVALLRVGPGVPRRRRAARRRHLELPAGARRHVRIRHPAVQRRPGVDRGLLREGSRVRSRSRCSARRRRTSSSSVRPAATRSSRRSRTTRPTSKRSSSTRSRSRCSRITSPTTRATSPSDPTCTCTRATAVRISRATTRSTTSSGTSRPTATPRRTRRRRARSCSPRATSTRVEVVQNMDVKPVMEKSFEPRARRGTSGARAAGGA